MMRSVPQEREVICPSCSATRRTKANRNVWITCLSCGHAFRVPAGTATTPAAPAAPAGPVAAGGVVVEHATVKVPQAARPRERGTADVASDDQDARTTGSAPAEDHPPRPVPSGRTGDPVQLAEAGRRGGLARYARSRIRV
jgi:hypothetical protein